MLDTLIINPDNRHNYVKMAKYFKTNLANYTFSKNEDWKQIVTQVDETKKEELMDKLESDFKRLGIKAFIS